MAKPKTAKNKNKNKNKKSNLETLIEFEAISKTANLAPDQIKAINALSKGEVQTLINVRRTVPALVGMKFNAAGGIF